jgi:hypothetical protein
MKYWNKRKNSRKNWYSVIVGPTILGTRGLKLWCQRDESSGRFFYTAYFKNNDGFKTEWLFEDSGDAVVFKMLHG